METKHTWICDQERVLLSSPVMSIVEQKCHSSDDQRPFTFYLLRSRDWCNIIPVTEAGNVVFVKQYRIGIARHTVEIPGGVADATDADFQAAALRELEEETGYIPLPGARCLLLGSVLPNPAILNNRCHSLIVGPVKRTQAQRLDDGEMIEVLEIPIQEIPERILRGEIDHALMLNAFFLLSLRNPESKALLSRELDAFCRI